MDSSGELMRSLAEMVATIRRLQDQLLAGLAETLTMVYEKD